MTITNLLHRSSVQPVYWIRVLRWLVILNRRFRGLMVMVWEVGLMWAWFWRFVIYLAYWVKLIWFFVTELRIILLIFWLEKGLLVMTMSWFGVWADLGWSALFLPLVSLFFLFVFGASLFSLLCFAGVSGCCFVFAVCVLCAFVAWIKSNFQKKEFALTLTGWPPQGHNKAPLILQLD